jgi:hypothetical protein
MASCHPCAAVEDGNSNPCACECDEDPGDRETGENLGPNLFDRRISKDNINSERERGGKCAAEGRSIV